MKIYQTNNTAIADNSYFRKLFSYFATTTIILFTVITLIISSIILYHYNKELKMTGMQSLNTSVAVSETTLNSLYNYCYTLYNSNSSVSDILYAEEFTPQLSITFAEFQNNYLNYYNLIDSIYLINFSADIIFSTLSTCETSDTFYDQQILSLLQNESLPLYSYLFLPRTFTDANQKSHRVITMIFRSFEQHAFVINISQEHYQHLISNTNDFFPNALVINKDGVGLSKTDVIPFQTNVSSSKWYQDIQSSPQTEGSFRTSFNGKTYLVLFNKNNAFQFTYVFLLEHSPFGITNIFFFSTIAFFALFVILSLIVSLFLTYKMYQPIQNLYNTVRGYKRETSSQNTDELTYLSDSIAELVDHYHISQKSQKQLYLAEREKQLQQLISINNYYGTLNKEALQKYHFDLDGDGFLIIIFSLDHASSLISSDPKEYNLMMYSLENIATEILSESFRQEHTGMGYGEITYIIPNMADTSLDILLPLLKKTMKCMHEYFAQTITISLSNVCDTLFELQTAYLEAQTALRYRFLKGENCILKYADVTPDCSDCDLSYQQEKRVIAALTSCKETNAYESLSSYFESLHDIPIDNIILNIMSLNIAFQTMELENNLPNTDCLAPYSNFYDYFSMKEIQQRFMQRIHDDITQLAEIRQNQSSKPQLICQVVEYVKDHLCSPQLTVENIAVQIHLSTNYLRSIFKEHMGISLSKYINDQKIQYACRLLTETDDSIQELCEHLDFTSVNYFYTYFKKHTGMTPNQYRESYQKKE